MKIPVRVHDRGFAFNITPLIDVVFLLIIFFLVASHFIHNEQAERIELPIASEGQNDDEASHRLVVTVMPNGDLFEGLHPLTLDEFEQRLQLLIAQHSAETAELRIRADRSVAYVRVEPLLLAATRHGVTHVRFAVLRD